MNRRTEIKLENAKIFARKYVFSGRFIVRNTLIAMGIASIAGGSLIASDIVESRCIDNSTVSSIVAESFEDDKYVIVVGDDSMLTDESVGTLYSYFADEDVIKATVASDSLTASETDMTGKFIVTTEGLNLRAEASEQGNILKVLNTGDSGEVVGTDGDWTIVSTKTEGESILEGYVKSEYIITDDEATEVAKKAAKEGISYRDAIGVEEILVADAAAEEQVTSTPVVEEEEKIAEKTTAKTDTMSMTETTTAKTTEVTTETTTEVTTEVTTQATTEAPTEALTEAVTEAPASSSDLYLLAAIVYAESGGESYEGQLAVASVVLNRLYSGKWGSTLSEVIYAPSQFTGAYTSAFSTALSTGGSTTSLQAAQDAMNGANNVGGCLYFRPSWNVDTSSLSSYTQIGNHIFY